MKQISYIILTISLIWWYICWHWYICNIKWFCNYWDKTTYQTEQKNSENNSNSLENITDTWSEIENKNSTWSLESEKNISEEPCKDIITKTISINSSENNTEEVKKLEQFLVNFQNEDLEINWIYEEEDIEAVKRFQLKYSDEILKPWWLETPTWYIYKTTIKKINSVYCSGQTLEN